MSDDRTEAEIVISGGVRVNNAIVRLKSFMFERRVVQDPLDENGEEVEPRVTRVAWVWHKTLEMYVHGEDKPFSTKSVSGIAYGRDQLLQAISTGC
jgi:hypothetical protein